MQKNYEEVFEFTGPCGEWQGFDQYHTEEQEYRKKREYGVFTIHR